jgi:hypothetical protein
MSSRSVSASDLINEDIEAISDNSKTFDEGQNEQRL